MNSDDPRLRLSPEESLAIAQGFDRSFNRMKSRVWSARWIPIGAMLLLCALYVGDYIVVEYRTTTRDGALGSVEIHQYLKTRLKSGRSEYASGDSFDQTCVHSVFPHLGYNPCWYVYRNRQQQLDY